MNVIIEQYGIGNTYFIGCDNQDHYDRDMAEKLGLTYRKYVAILKRNGATKRMINGEYEFHNKCDAEKALVELNPYIVIAKLISGGVT